MKSTIWTIGHSTRTIEEFIEILNVHRIGMVIDVRTVPKSRHVPQFNIDALEKYLAEHKIGYKHMAELGGLRHSDKNSFNTGWKNKSFRGYADYMQTRDFKKGIERLISIAKDDSVVIMCAEAVPWRCHRSLIGDALLVRGISVQDLMDKKTSRPHTLTPFAHVDGTQITYPKS